MLPTIAEDWMSLSSESSSNSRTGEEVETDLFSKKTSVFLKGRWALKGHSLTKKASLPNSRRLSPLVESITS